MNMSVDNLYGDWWGGGDDMIFIDRDPENYTWPPDLHGTGARTTSVSRMGHAAHAQPALRREPWCEIKEGNLHHSKGKGLRLSLSCRGSNPV